MYTCVHWLFSNYLLAIFFIARVPISYFSSVVAFLNCQVVAAERTLCIQFGKVWPVSSFAMRTLIVFNTFSQAMPTLFSYELVDTEAEYNESCKGLKVTDEQECFPGVERKPYVYMVKLLARNKYGSAASQSELCKANCEFFQT